MAEILLDYLEESGPGVVEIPADAIAPAPEVPPTAPAAQYPGWDRETIETFLRGTGAGIHLLAGKGESDWLMLQEDLDRIAPPLTRICNRYEPVLRLSPVADPLLVAHGMALYGWRSALERIRAIRDAEGAPEPVTGGASYVNPAEATPEDLEPTPAPVSRPEDLEQPTYFERSSNGR